MSDASSPIVIAIDGPAASGKSTVAREVAARLGLVYVNTGSMYRGVTWWLLREQADFGDAEALARLVDGADIQCGIRDGEVVFSVNGEDPLPHIRGAEINAHVSKAAQVPRLRERLVEAQRELGRAYGVVMEGRDIGTVVFTETPYKIFVDASPEVRAQRRSAQGEEDAVAKRDAEDRTRAAAPLKKADDAAYIDNSHCTVAEVLAEVGKTLEAQGLAGAAAKLEG